MPANRQTPILLGVCALAWAAIVLNRAVFTVNDVVYEATVEQPEVESFARARLSELQQRSFAEGVEVCGMIAENSSGELVSRSVMAGDEGTCDIQYFDVRSLLPLATFHTHGGFSYDYDSEVPSTIDMRSDIGGELDGYISTPGGRLWHVDWQDGVARMVCGEGCLPKDERYRPCNAPAPGTTFTLEQLQERERMVWTSC